MAISSAAAWKLERLLELSQTMAPTVSLAAVVNAFQASAAALRARAKFSRTELSLETQRGWARSLASAAVHSSWMAF